VHVVFPTVPDGAVDGTGVADGIGVALGAVEGRGVADGAVDGAGVVPPIFTGATGVPLFVLEHPTAVAAAANMTTKSPLRRTFNCSASKCKRKGARERPFGVAVRFAGPKNL